MAIGVSGSNTHTLSGSNTHTPIDEAYTTMTIKDDCPTDEVAKKRKISRMTSRRYDSKVSRQKKEMKRSSTRAKAAAAKANIKLHAAMDNSLEFGLTAGFRIASKYFTNTDKLREHVEGKFTEWKLTRDPPRNSHGNVVLAGASDDGDNVPIMQVNRNYGHPTRSPDMVRWVSIRASSLVDSEGYPVGKGLFAERPFKKGEIVGVFSGERVRMLHTMTLITHPYCMHLHGANSGVDAKGGVESSHPIGMAMHLINDPHFGLIHPDSNPNKNRSANVEFQSSGVCVATRSIPKGRELLVHYSSGGVSQLDA